MVSDGNASVRIAGGDQVHRRAADEGGHIDGVRPGEDLRRTSDLQDLPIHEDRHPVGQGHRLLLVVRDVDCGTPSERCSFLSSTRVSRRSLASRFESGSSRRNSRGLRTMARARATRCCWPPESWPGLRSRRWSISTLRPPRGRARSISLGGLRHLERKADVLATRHVRVERIALEDHRDVAIAGRRRSSRRRRRRRHAPAVGVSRPARMRSVVVLPEPDGPEQREELARLDLEIDALQGRDRPVRLTIRFATAPARACSPPPSPFHGADRKPLDDVPLRDDAEHDHRHHRDHRSRRELRPQASARPRRS